MNDKTDFVIHEHKAKKAGLHYDLRIKIERLVWPKFFQLHHQSYFDMFLWNLSLLVVQLLYLCEAESMLEY